MTTPDMRVAIVVDPSLPLGLVANTVATICIGIGAAQHDFGGMLLTDAVGRTVQTSSNCPVPILQAPGDVIRTLLLRALPAPAASLVVPFPKFARSLHRFEDYLAEFPRYDLASETIEGLGLAGTEKWVRSLTGNLKLLR